MSPRSPEITVVLETLADGQWHPGRLVMNAVERIIPSHVANGKCRMEHPERFSVEERIASGKREVVRDVIGGLVKRGRVECDVGTVLGARCWRGEIEWNLRDAMHGWRSVVETADELDMSSNTLRNWVERGYVPHSESKAGILMFTPAQFEIVRRVRAAWGGDARLPWAVDPRTIWASPVPDAPSVVVCPHCNGPLTMTLDKAE